VKGKPGKLKPMGLDLKRSDTPKIMQKFLEKILMDLLTGVSKEDIFQSVREFRKEFASSYAWEKGMPKKVSAYTDYSDKKKASETVTVTSVLKKGEKGGVAMPGHARAAINWNLLCEMNGDLYSKRIGDGEKIVVCDLIPNTMKMTSVAFPIDEPHLPQWFKDLPFDHTSMEEKIIDNKLENLLGVLEWDLNETKERVADDLFVF
jgi:hypothetical protein